MEAMLARASVRISELKHNPSAIIEEAGGEPVAVLNHNKPADLVPAAAWEALVEYLDDLELAKLVEERKGEPTVKVRLDDL